MRCSTSIAWRIAFGLLGLAGLGGCGPHDEGLRVAGYRLELRGGVYGDGSGRRGLALLATFRDAQGRGPAEPWTATLADEQGSLGQPFSYDSSSPGSYGVWWWPDLGLGGGEPYTLTLTRADGVRLTGALRASFSDGLDPPRVELSADGARLLWEAVPGAQSYACRVYSGGQLQLSTHVLEPGCDVSALPPGSYSASVLAFGADLPALALDSAQAPALPAELHVSEGRMAFGVGGGAGVLRGSVAGGGIDYGSSTPGLAVWLSLTGADGTPLAEPWTVEILGPGLSADAPLRLSYPASARQYLAWSYDTPALEGRYTVAATSSAGSLSTTFSVGHAEALPMVTDAVAAAQPSGGARVTWTAITGARTYYVSAWADGAASLASSLWVTTPDAFFPPGTFTPGLRYDVYVAATNVDLASLVAPTRVLASENIYLPASFVAQ